jgi:transcriptional regulator with XRE-family HTH domain
VSCQGFSARLRTARIAANLTQEGLGSRLSPPVVKQAVYRWESGRVSPPRAETLRQIAELLDVDLSWLAFG